MGALEAILSWAGLWQPRGLAAAPRARPADGHLPPAHLHLCCPPASALSILNNTVFTWDRPVLWHPRAALRRLGSGLEPPQGAGQGVRAPSECWAGA